MTYRRPLASICLLVSLLTAGALSQENAGAPSLLQNVVVERDIEYGKGGDISLKLDLTRPKTEREQPRPVVVWVHGGAWQAGNESSGARALVPLVATGDYVGVSVGYRLTDIASWPAQIHDCKAAIRWIRANAKKYNIDADKIGVWGAFAGGHLVSLLGTSGDVTELEGENGSPGQSSRVTCVVDFCGPSDFLAFGKDNPRLNVPTSPVFKLLGGPLSEKVSVARSASPVTFASKDDAPFLIVHGTNDTTVLISQAERLHATLEKAGVSSVFVRVEGGGHAIGGPAVIERVKAFFDKQLLGKDATVSPDPIKG